VKVGPGGVGITVFKLAALMSVDDGFDHRQSMMGFMELGTAAGRKEIQSARR
jgi:hypothetical protein